jgi:hypothetical protein
MVIIKGRKGIKEEWRKEGKEKGKKKEIEE